MQRDFEIVRIELDNPYSIPAVLTVSYSTYQTFTCHQYDESVSSHHALHLDLLTDLLQLRTTKDVVMPLSTPIRGRDGTMINEIPVPKGTGVVVGILACNRSPAIWGPDAHEWKPERFLKPLPESVGEAHVPGIYSNL